MNLNQYENDWNALSWEIQDANNSFQAMLGWNDWQRYRFETMKAAGIVHQNRFSYASGVISKALLVHFFISICRIREETNSTISLFVLHKKANKLNLLKDAKLDLANNLIAQTKTKFLKIKKARGTVVAHLNLTNTTALQILINQGLSREDTLEYLNDCNELFYLLGEPIGKNNSYKKMELKNELYNEMYDLNSIIDPI